VDPTLFANLLGAVGLSAAAGLNAWIPLLGLGLAERLGWVELTGRFDVLGSTPVLIALGIVFVLDLVGDKIAVIDHVLHAIGTVVAPLSGAVVFAAQENLISEVHPLLAAGAGVVLGESMHVGRSALRPAVTATTGGVGNPIVSLIEDVFSAVLTLLAVIVPVLAFLFLVAMTFFAVRFLRRWRRRRSAAREQALQPAPFPPPGTGGPRAVP
jgi:large-conductance mechanosensitive channel